MLQFRSSSQNFNYGLLHMSILVSRRIGIEAEKIRFIAKVCSSKQGRELKERLQQLGGISRVSLLSDIEDRDVLSFVGDIDVGGQLLDLLGGDTVGNELSSEGEISEGEF